MIIETYPSLRTPAPVPVTTQKKGIRYPSASDRSRAMQFNVSPEEFVRRDDIVRQMFLDCKFSVNDVCEPVTSTSKEMYGKCIIKKIFRSYHDFPTAQAMDWPSDDRPLIVTAETEKKPDGTELILCTPKYLQKYTQETC
jgi:hypothetical protein